MLTFDDESRAELKEIEKKTVHCVWEKASIVLTSSAYINYFQREKEREEYAKLNTRTTTRTTSNF
jgi:hypothetical protein